MNEQAENLVRVLNDITTRQLNQSIDQDISEMAHLFADELDDLPQVKKIEHVMTLILGLMDYTEQSPDEKIWCHIYEILKAEKLKIDK